MDAQMQLIFKIVDAINGDPDEPNFGFRKEDPTQFFIAYVKAGNYIFNKITGQEMNNLEFTHLANQLIVQDLLSRNVKPKETE